MKYKGIELVEFESTEPVLFNPPKKMLVWDDASTECFVTDVVAFLPTRECLPVVGRRNSYYHCAEIPEERTLATYRELARWIAEGKGELKVCEYSTCSALSYMEADENKPVPEFYRVRKWDDKEWHKVTRGYIYTEDK